MKEENAPFLGGDDVRRVRLTGDGAEADDLVRANGSKEGFSRMGTLANMQLAGEYDRDRIRALALTEE